MTTRAYTIKEIYTKLKSYNHNSVACLISGVIGGEGCKLCPFLIGKTFIYSECFLVKERRLDSNKKEKFLEYFVKHFPTLLLEDK